MVVVHDVAEVVSAAVMGLPHAHRVVREVDIAVVAWEWSVGYFLRGSRGDQAAAGTVPGGRSLQKTAQEVSILHVDIWVVTTYISACWLSCVCEPVRVVKARVDSMDI